ncbi:MAG TPA: KEOPS complex subunit Pcc1 [Candidatus Bathyarchaeia archaeon]|nr:KEOPS complex subunit Pcc1 [Candidatus Bathyarchaeia archaeon]
MLEADICIRYGSSKLARAVTSAILPDNELVSGKLRISTNLAGSELKIHVGGCARIETLQATIQDLFRCIHAAEGSFSVTERRRRKL